MLPSLAEHQVMLEPAAFRFSIRDGESLMQAATRAGIKWPSICGGRAECGVCYVELLEGRASTPLPDEVNRLEMQHVKPTRGGPLRLACQMLALEDLRVYRTLVRVPRPPGDR
jgi:2Fe-2S ferredoxin